MAVQADGFPHLSAEVVSVKGHCSAGHQVGDTLKLGCWDPGGLCGYFYHDIFPNISVLQFGGQYPWSPDGQLTLGCPDQINQVTIRLKKSE